MDWEEIDKNVMMAKEKYRQDVERKVAKGIVEGFREIEVNVGETDPIRDLESYLNKCLGE